MNIKKSHTNVDAMMRRRPAGRSANRLRAIGVMGPSGWCPSNQTESEADRLIRINKFYWSSFTFYVESRSPVDRTKGVMHFLQLHIVQQEVSMAKQEAPDLSHLGGREIEKIATALVSGNLETILNRRDELLSLKSEQLTSLIDLAAATRANCGGFGCG